MRLPFLLLPLVIACGGGSPMASDDPPSVDGITDQVTNEGVPVAVTVTVDDETPSSVSLGATSSNTTLVPSAALVFSGAGATRTLTVTPAGGETGASTITVTATDGGGQVASTAFELTVNSMAADDPPSLASIAGQTTDEDVAVAVTVTVTDEVPATVVLSATSSNTTLVPNAALVFTGSGASRTLTVTPATGEIGTTSVTVVATDAAAQADTVEFDVTVTGGGQGGTFAWSELLEASDGASQGRFGYAVGASGDVVAVGARADSGPGKVYVFRDGGGAYVETWNDSRTGSGAAFGSFVALDGDYLAVGQSGRTVVYRRLGSAADDWTAEDSLTTGGPVDLSGDRLIVSDFNQTVTVHLRAGTDWSLEATLDPGGLAADDEFGVSVAFDGDVAVVGAEYDDDAATDAGAAYVFRRSGAGWAFEQKLAADDGATDDLFGRSVAVEGDLIVVGAPGDDDNGSISGSAYVFQRNGGVWGQAAKLTEGDAGDQLGNAVELSGGELLIASPAWGTSAAFGAAWHYTGSGSSWTGSRLGGAGSGEGDAVGFSIAFDGDVVFLGAPNGDATAMNAGEVHVLRR